MQKQIVSLGRFDPITRQQLQDEGMVPAAGGSCSVIFSRSLLNGARK